MMVRLGIVVTDSAFAHQVVHLVRAARERDWRAECFLTDTGVMLLADPGFLNLARAHPSSVSVCEHSIDRYVGEAVDLEAIKDAVVIGGQYQNAEMVHRCGKVLVF